VGGGIVYDSVPASEYAEVMLKARPLLAALGSPRAVGSRQVERVNGE